MIATTDHPTDTISTLGLFASADFRNLFAPVRRRVPRRAFAAWRQAIAQLTRSSHWPVAQKQEAMAIIGDHVANALTARGVVDEWSGAVAVLTLAAASYATEQPWPRQCVATLGMPDSDHPELVARALDALYARASDCAEAPAAPLGFLEVATAVRHIGRLEAKVADGTLASGPDSPLQRYFTGLRAVRAGGSCAVPLGHGDPILRYLAARALSDGRLDKQGRERSPVLWTWREQLRYALGGDTSRWTWGGRLRAALMLFLAVLALGAAALWIRAARDAQRIEHEMIQPLMTFDAPTNEVQTR